MWKCSFGKFSFEFGQKIKIAVGAYIFIADVGIYNKKIQIVYSFKLAGICRKARQCHSGNLLVT